MKICIRRLVTAVLASVMLTSVIPSTGVVAVDTNIVTQDSKLKYLYLNKDYVEEGESQEIVVSWVGGEHEVKKMTLSLIREDGEEFFADAIEYNGDTALFCFNLEKGVYQVTELEVVTLETEHVYIEDCGIQAFFGVGEEYSGEKSEHVEMESVEYESEIEMAVVSIDSENISQTESMITESLETTEINVMAFEEENTTEENRNLVVVLDPGHDAGHAGAQANNVGEEVATLKIAKYCRAELENYAGVTVYLTREDEKCPFPETVGVSGGNILDIEKRVAWAASMGADVFVSIHLNSSDYSTAKGAEVYYPSASTEGKELAQEIQEELVELGLYDRKIKANDKYAVICNSTKHGFPGLIIEHAFLSNSTEAASFLQTEEGLKKLGVADATGIAAYYQLGEGEWIKDSKGWKYKLGDNYVENSWKYIRDAWYYFDVEGYSLTGWLTLGGNQFYLDESGAAVTGLQEIEGNTYYFDTNCYMQFGWQTINGVKYYFNTITGILESSDLRGWKYQDGKWYYYDYLGNKATGWNKVQGNWYYMNETGEMQTGWVKDHGYWYYLNRSGEMQTGWVKDYGYWYYLNRSGEMQTGWLEEGNYKYYLTESGAAATGLQTIDGNVYYFDSNAYMQFGWKTINGVRYYFNTTTGVLEKSDLQGWKYQDGKWYYYDVLGHKMTGWVYVNEVWYYLNRNGEMQTGWVKVHGYWYYLNRSGEMQTGWVKEHGYWYYLNRTGEMQTGWLEEGNYKYYLTESGAAATGLQTINGNTYYFDSNAYMQFGWQTIDGVKYYFNPETGIMEIP